MTKTGLSLLQGKTYYFAVKARNKSSLWSAIGYSDGIKVDTTPPTGTISINDGAAYTLTTAVTLSLSATDNSGTVSQMRCSNENVTYSTPEPYATTKTWTLTSGDGTKTVYVKFKDAAGNWSNSMNAQITLDTTEPSLSAVTTTDITASSATITWTTDEAASSQVEYGPTTSYGQSTVIDSTLLTTHSVALSGLTAGTLYHARVHSTDAAGHEALSVDFTFTTPTDDTTRPTGSVTINSGAGWTNTLTVTLTLAATDNSGVVSQMQFSDDHVTYAPAEPYATTKPWILPSGDGPKTVYVKFADAASLPNWSSPASNSITLDTVPPSGTMTSPPDGAVVAAQ